MRLSILGAAALALLAAGCGGEPAENAAQPGNAALEPVAAPQGDWTQVVSATPEGGFRMGNPDAPVKLVEYASLSCPFCARFEAEGAPALRDRYVKSGQVSWEFRTYMNHATDPGVSLLVHCQGPAPFFQLAESLYATQDEWTGRVQALPPAQLQQIGTLPPVERAAALVRAAGLDRFFRERGMPEARIRSCLADEAGLTRLVGITERGNSDGIAGTPNFLINGRLAANASDWKTLEPQLRAAVR
jgi:protein-disulfide isomerase